MGLNSRQVIRGITVVDLFSYKKKERKRKEASFKDRIYVVYIKDGAIASSSGILCRKIYIYTDYSSAKRQDSSHLVSLRDKNIKKNLVS